MLSDLVLERLFDHNTGADMMELTICKTLTNVNILLILLHS